MYNLTVAGAHTYYVGTGQWLVHNDCNIVGTPQRTSPGHDIKILSRGQVAIDSGDVTDIYYNKSLNTITEGNVPDAQRPDYAFKFDTGHIVIGEVPSPSQTMPEMQAKIDGMLEQLWSAGYEASGEVLP